jgi:hypothetical protein
MRLINIERPSALPAALAQVVCAPAGTVAPTAHVPVVGWTAVRPGSANDNPQHQRQVPTRLAFGTIGGFSGKGIGRGYSAMDGVSGVPPRGRPV